jgi:hypothetical protein
MPLIPFSPDKPLHPDALKVCVKCKHFAPRSSPVNPSNSSSSNGPAKGTCRLFGMVNVIDGTIQYADVHIVRDQFCKSTYYEEL